MSFENLPSRWDTLPINDPGIMDDVVDLFAGHADRLRRSLLVLLCDDTGRLLQPLCINDLPRRPSHDDMVRTVSFLGTMADHEGEISLTGLGILFALAYPEDRDVSPGDRVRWAAVIRETCAANGITFLGLRLATVDRVGPLVTAGRAGPHPADGP